MPRLYRTQLWQLQVPETWAVRDDPGQTLVTFYRPDGVGLLQVITPEEEELPHPSTKGENFDGRLPGKTWTSKDNGTARRTWRLSCRGRWIWIRYECAAMHAALEGSDVESIVRSIEERQQD